MIVCRKPQEVHSITELYFILGYFQDLLLHWINDWLLMEEAYSRFFIYKRFQHFLNKITANLVPSHYMKNLITGFFKGTYQWKFCQVSWIIILGRSHSSWSCWNTRADGTSCRPEQKGWTGGEDEGYGCESQVCFTFKIVVVNRQLVLEIPIFEIHVFQKIQRAVNFLNELLPDDFWNSSINGNDTTHS